MARVDKKKTDFVAKLTGKQTRFLVYLLITFILISCSTTPLRDGGGLDPEVSKLLQAPVSADLYPDADIVYLLDEVIEEVFSDGRTNCTGHKVIKIISERGKNCADRKIGYDSRTEAISLLYAWTITPDGKIIPLKKKAIKVMTPYSKFPNYSDYKKLTFSMPGVTAGCVIDYKYIKKEKKPVIPGKFAGRFHFQTYNPILLSRRTVITPDDMDLNYLLVNPLKDVQQSPTVTRRGGKKIYLWEYRDIPQILDEYYKPPVEEIAFNILVTTMGSWEEFFRWWREQIEGKVAPDEAIKEKVAELTRDLSTTREKTEAIFDYMKREIRYVSVDLGKSGYEPEPAPEVFENKYGDCKDQSTLLISMLKAAGIPAHYVLIPTHNMGNLIKEFPYPFQFDHCIVAAGKEEGRQFLDPTAEYHRFDYLPEDDQDRGVLIFEDQRTIFGRTPLAEPESNAHITQQHIAIEADGAIEVKLKNLSSGRKAAFERSFYINLCPTEIKEALEEFIDGASPGAKVLEHTYTDPLDFKKEFTEYIKFYAPDYCKKAGDILIFHVPMIEKWCPGSGKEERRYPILYRSNSYRKDDVEFNIPEGYEVYYLPEPIEIKNPYLEYRSSYRTVGTKVFYQGQFIQKAGQIPSEDYANYHKSCQEVEKSCRRYVSFRQKR
jgi:hypothetical protein